MRLEFIVEGPPVSQQTRRRDRLREWQQRVRQAAEKYWLTEQTIALGPVMLQITYFYEAFALDVDNIIKPILDAIIGLAYVDDEQVTDVLVRKRLLSSELRVKDITPVLAAGFSLGYEFLHIVILDAPDQEVLTPWPPYLQST